MSWDEVKDEKEGYVRVRKSDDRALVGRLRKENEDPDAKGYIELKVDDLGFEGGGGPHTHNNYALTGHTHDEYLTELPDHTHPEYEGGTGGGYDDTELMKRLEQDEAVIEDHDKRLDEDDSNIAKNRQKIDNIQMSINDINNNKLPGKADVGHTHDSEGGGESYDDSWIQPALDSKSDTAHTHDGLGGGDSYDDSEVRDLIQGNADAIAEIQTKGYDDTELSGRVSETESKNTQQDQRLGSLEAKQSVNTDDIADLYALSEKKADADHTHDAPDLTHEHEGMVTSASVVSIVRLSQAEFDALADKNSSTLYLVV